MIDADALVREFLAAQTAMQALFGQRIYASLDPPSGYSPEPVVGKPNTGPALVFTIGSGEGRALWKPTGEFLAYANSEAVARQAGMVVAEALDAKAYKAMRSAFVISMPQLIRNPDTNWLASRIQVLFTFATTLR